MTGPVDETPAATTGAFGASGASRASGGTSGSSPAGATATDATAGKGPRLRRALVVGLGLGLVLTLVLDRVAPIVGDTGEREVILVTNSRLDGPTLDHDARVIRDRTVAILLEREIGGGRTVQTDVVGRDRIRLTMPPVDEWRPAIDLRPERPETDDVRGWLHPLRETSPGPCPPRDRNALPLASGGCALLGERLLAVDELDVRQARGAFCPSERGRVVIDMSLPRTRARQLDAVAARTGAGAIVVENRVVARFGNLDEPPCPGTVPRAEFREEPEATRLLAVDGGPPSARQVQTALTSLYLRGSWRVEATRVRRPGG